LEDINAKFKKLDVLPMVKKYMEQLDVYNIFKKYIPKPERCPIEPAQILSMMIINIVCAANPLYKIEEWISDYTDGMVESPINAAHYNDDQLGKNLDRLFGANRNSIMTELAIIAIQIFELETNRMHNDSTSITFSGAYKFDDPKAVKLTQGFNKDHRPDHKQIVFGLNITSDGHVPLSFQLFNGNRTDDTTHIPNWDGLRTLLEKDDFIYVADCKLCSVKNMKYIADNGGFFITILPKNRGDVKTFYKKIQRESVQWEDAYIAESTRKKGEVVVYRTYEDGLNKQGYRIIWVHSSAKQQMDETRREHMIAKIEQELQELSVGLNRYYLKTEEQINAAITKVCKGGKDLVKVQLIEDKELESVQVKAGKPGPNTKYRETEKITYRIQWEVDLDAIEKASKIDGIFPLITNTEFKAADVLRMYKDQPYLEKRMYTTKSILNVAPVFLKLPRRIEAITFLYFIGLMIVSLMERNIRRNMVQEEIEKLPILPNQMNTKTPTFNNIKYLFRNVHLSVITNCKKIIQENVNGVTEIHRIVLRLLEVPVSTYLALKDNWWNFQGS